MQGVGEKKDASLRPGRDKFRPPLRRRGYLLRREGTRRLGLRLRRLTQNWREGQWQRRRPWRRDLSLRELAMFWSTSTSFRVASFFQRGPTGALSRRPLKKSLISVRGKPMSVAKRMRRTRSRASLG